MRGKKSHVIVIAAFFSVSLMGEAWLGRDLPKDFDLGQAVRITDSAKVLSLQFPKARFIRQPEGKLGIYMGSPQKLVSSSTPILPFYTRNVVVPLGQKAKVSMTNVQLEESAGSVPVKLLGKPMEWSINPKLRFDGPEARYFPGKLFHTVQQGADLKISLFPVQWDRVTGKLLQVRSAELVVDFEPITISHLDGAGRTSIILTTQKLKDAAAILQKFHKEKLGLSSEIVTIEQIGEKETPIEEENLPEGYKDPKGRDEAVIPFDPNTKAGYPYELARKIVRYTQRRISQGGVKTITILGNDVPPSYYFANPSEWHRYFTPTDRCYSAINKCQEVKAAVGRLPFSGVEEVTAYVAKATTWLQSISGASSELALFGGQAFPSSDVYIGELGTLQTLEYGSWQNVKKFFQTKKNYTRETALELVTGKHKTAFTYYLDHGNGNQWYVDSMKKDYVTSTEILQAQPAEDFLSPVIVSIACTNAAYDELFAKEELFSSASEGEISVGVALLKSKAGSVAYLGSARPAVGQPIYNFDTKGNLNLEGTNHGLRLLDGFYEKYAEKGAGTIGDLFMAASLDYVGKHGAGLALPEDAWTFFVSAVLGDPNLPLPKRKDGEKAEALALSTLPLDDSNGLGLPILNLKGIKESLLTFSAPTPVQATLYRVDRKNMGSYAGETILFEGAFESGENQVKLNVGEDKDAQYFLKLENRKGLPKERHIMMRGVTE